MSYTANTFVDATGSIVTLNVSQQVVAANISRKGFIFVNTSDTAMNLRFGSVAATTAASIPVAAGAVFSMLSGVCAGTALQVICSAATKTYYYAELY